MSLALPPTLWLSRLVSGGWHHCSVVSVVVAAAVVVVVVVAVAGGRHRHLFRSEQCCGVPSTVQEFEFEWSSRHCPLPWQTEPGSLTADGFE